MIKRGNVVILNLGGNVGKPRPALVIQNNILNDILNTTIILPFSSDLQDVDTFRFIILATTANGLQINSQLMIDKVSQIPKDRVQRVIGKITKKQMDEIEVRLLAVLGIG